MAATTDDLGFTVPLYTSPTLLSTWSSPARHWKPGLTGTSAGRSRVLSSKTDEPIITALPAAHRRSATLPFVGHRGDFRPQRISPRRQAILLLGGDKAGNWKSWYDKNIPTAEQRYKNWLATEGGG